MTTTVTCLKTELKGYNVVIFLQASATTYPTQIELIVGVKVCEEKALTLVLLIYHFLC